LTLGIILTVTYTPQKMEDDWLAKGNLYSFTEDVVILSV